MKNVSLFLTFTFTMVMAAACGPAEEEGHNVNEEVCEHMGEGPEVALTASETTADAPDASAEHTRHDITIGESGAGFVSYASDEEGEVVVALSDGAYDITFTQDGTEITPEVEDVAEFACTIGKAFHVPLAIGAVDIEITGAAGEVSMVIEHLEEEGEHEDEE